MDAVEFLNEYSRLCDYYTPHDCQKCPLFETKNCSIVEGEPDFELIVSITEQWSREHPRKTRANDFWEKHPNAKVDCDFYTEFCCETLGYCKKCKHGYDAYACKDCWNEPV